MKNKLLYLIAICFILASCSTTSEKSDAYGNFESNETIVSAQAQGELLYLSLEEGSTLNEGDLLGIVDTTSLHLKKEQLISNKAAILSRLNGTNAQIAVQEQQKENILIDKVRVENLLKDGAATQKQLDDINASLRMIEKQIESLKVQKEVIIKEAGTIDTQVKQVEESISKCYIVNPVKGTVLTKYIEEKELVVPGKPLYKIANLDKLLLKAYISGSQLPHVKLGQNVEVLIDNTRKTNTKLEGSVTWISDQAEFTPKIIQTKEERVNLVYAIKVEVVNDGSLKIGMPGEINF